MRSAIGAFEVSSVVSQTGQTSSDSSSAGVGRSSLAARRCRGREPDGTEGEEPPHAGGASARSMPLSSSSGSRTSPAMRWTTRPRASTKYVSGNPVTP